MKITDLTENLLIRLDVRDRLIPLREINYRDIQVGDIFVKSPYGFGYIAIQVTGKNIKDTEAGRWSLGEELLTYDVYHINDDDEVVLDVKGHNFPYEELVRERWKLLGAIQIQNPIITLNYPGKPLNSRNDY